LGGGVVGGVGSGDAVAGRGGGDGWRCWCGAVVGLEAESREAAQELVVAAGARAEGRVAVDYFSVVLFLGFEIEESVAMSARLSKNVVCVMRDLVPVVTLGREAVALQRVEIEGLEPAPWP
jgi:hypothetical protein